jgi:ankyrin repeat protein
MEKIYKIIYICKLKPETSHSDVVQKVSSLLKISTEKSEKFICSQKPIVIKNGLSYESVQKYKNIFSEIGLEVKIIEIINTKPKQPHQKPIVTGEGTKQNNQEIKSKEIETKALSEGEHSSHISSFSKTTDTAKSTRTKQRDQELKWYQIGYNKILGTFVMLWGVGGFIRIFENFMTNHSSIPRLLFVNIITSVFALIPVVIGWRIFKTKQYSNSIYVLGIVIISTINISSYVYFKDQIRSKISYHKVVTLNRIRTPELITATIKNDIDNIKLLISKGVDVNKKEPSGKTALHYAQNLEIIKILVEAGADVNVKDKRNVTILNSQGGSPNHTSYQATEYLIKNGLNENTINTQHNYTKSTALHRGDICHFCGDIKDYKDGPKNIELLIRQGGNSEIKNKNGETPIFTVSDESKKILINNGVNIFLINNRNENLLFKVKDAELLKELVNRGLDTNLINSQGETLLHYARDPQVIEMLVRKIDINSQNHEGRTALFFCYYLPEKLESLLKHHANPNVTNQKGETVLHQYVKDCSSDMGMNKELIKNIEYLLKTDIKINHKDNNGKTALDYAKFDKLKNLLVANGAKSSF